ncbi:hypothetical protein [Pontibacter sp. SGAir0037]|uniref:hypothetical protein n=1 Tax=Pontibacter sp. SGAir0037 TaxID=2571030 RepID=UPI0010CD36B1|nr:hypothetical protein [Pontibacter sp. SGAir0037]QCR25336.1 hypothetical protein C1N53_22735 [Pontibacter sp. SGAir0037]
MQNRKDQQRFAQSASALGAGILGFGLGAKWGYIVNDYVLVIMLVGAVLHASGMYVAQMRNTSSSTDKAARVLWYSAWACLVLLVGLVVYLLVDS